MAASWLKKGLTIAASAVVFVLVVGTSVLACLVFHQVHGDVFDSNGVPIHYTIQGAGPPVILVHGFGVNSDLNWRVMGVIGALSKHFQVVAMDCRGHGLSGKPHDPKQYGLEMAEDVVRLMDHLKIQKAHLAGYSMGGAIAMKLATIHPERFWSVAAGGAGWFRAGTSDGEIAIDIMRDNDATRGWGPFLRSLAGKKPGLGTVIGDSVERALNDNVALKALAESVPEICIDEAALRANALPVINIVGDRDSLKRTVDALEGVMPVQETVVIPGGTHSLVPRDPAFSAALIRFFTEHTPKSQG